jgi:hypothetical protein
LRVTVAMRRGDTSTLIVCNVISTPLRARAAHL